jgi:hypothetical protein
MVNKVGVQDRPLTLQAAAEKIVALRKGGADQLEIDRMSAEYRRLRQEI